MTALQSSRRADFYKTLAAYETAVDAHQVAQTQLALASSNRLLLEASVRSFAAVDDRFAAWQASAEAWDATMPVRWSMDQEGAYFPPVVAMQVSAEAWDAAMPVGRRMDQEDAYLSPVASKRARRA